MVLAFRCQCGQKLQAPHSMAGRTVRCQGCQQPIKVPGGKADVPGSSSQHASATKGATMGGQPKQLAASVTSDGASRRSSSIGGVNLLLVVGVVVGVVGFSVLGVIGAAVAIFLGTRSPNLKEANEVLVADATIENESFDADGQSPSVFGSTDSLRYPPAQANGVESAVSQVEESPPGSPTNPIRMHVDENGVARLDVPRVLSPDESDAVAPYGHLDTPRVVDDVNPSQPDKRSMTIVTITSLRIPSIQHWPARSGSGIPIRISVSSSTMAPAKNIRC